MPKGLIRATGALLTAVALYSLLGFLILPGIALRIANQQLANYATVPAHIERIELNPFSLELTLWGLKSGKPAKDQGVSSGCTPTCSSTACGPAPCTWPMCNSTSPRPSCCSTS